jgi:hypothetical protein
MIPRRTMRKTKTDPSHAEIFHLMTGTAGLSDDALELVDLGLGTAESSKSLLGELTGALVLAVAKQFHNAALVRGVTVEKAWLASGFQFQIF